MEKSQVIGRKSPCFSYSHKFFNQQCEVPENFTTFVGEYLKSRLREKKIVCHYTYQYKTFNGCIPLR